MRNSFEKFGLIAVGTLLGVTLSLNYSAWADKAPTTTLPLEDLRVFAEIFGKIKSDYVEPVEDKKLLNEAITGMLSGLDPHSTYLEPEAFKDLQAGTQGEFGGLGIEVAMEDGLVKVMSPIDDSPAAKAGIRTNDLIVKLDDTPVKGLTLNEAVKKMRGKPDTPIVLTIVRKGEANPLTFRLLRSVIKAKSIKPKLVEPNYAYVRITQFQEHTAEDLAKALKTLRSDNKSELKGLVLDLRNNPGGLLNAAVGVSAAFIPHDELVVYTEGRAEDSKMHLTANAENYVRGGSSKDFLRDLPEEYKSVPMAVLVNGGSASASEIVAGALQDHKRAVIVGTQTFGKGSVQTILPMNNGAAIKLTTARYFTPKGRSIQAKGIVPDINVEEDPNGSSSDKGMTLREADLSGHLSNPKDPEGGAKSDSTKPSEAGKSDMNKERFSDKVGSVEFGSRNDYQLNQALNLLKGMQILQKK